MKYFLTLAFSTALFTAAAAAAAADSGPAAGSRPVQISFGLQAAGADVSCGAVAVKLGRDARPATLRDARWYVHDVALIGADGKRTPVTLDQNAWQHQGIALIDLETGGGDAERGCTGNTDTHTAVTGQVPAGRYVGLSFQIGVPGQINHSNTAGAPAPLDLTAMAWVWQAGRRFMKVEVTPEGGIAREGSSARHWMLHLGSSGCTGNPATGEIVKCTAGNRFEVVLPRFDAAQDKVVLDLAKLLQDVEVGRDGGGAVGCMSAPDDPECSPLFARLGLGKEAGTAFRAAPRMR